MIQIIMLVLLGFCLAGFLAVLLAGPFWRRAERLTTRRLEATMPMTMSDIEADKDQLRADYAVQIRRLEMAYEKEKENAARFLVDRNKHRVEIAQLKAELERIEGILAERDSESTVLGQALRKQVPELEEQLERARQIIASRDRELARMATAYENQTEAVGIAKKTAQRYSEEIERLRSTLETGGGAALLRKAGGGAGEGGASEQLAAENAKLVARISRLRQQLEDQKASEAAENAALRKEMHRLAELMMSGKKPAVQQAEKDPKAEQPTAKEPASKDEKAGNSEKSAPAKKTTRRRKRGPSLTERLKGLSTTKKIRAQKEEQKEEA